MKKISKQVARSKTVENVLASLRIEKLVPGDYVIKGMNACVSGKNTTANVLQEVIRHHVTIRWG
ncbi:MAG: antitoxin VbhA family protein [Sulfuricellaceae bacterium]|nr:antitoxin VbhA family protein [Sulfuricellaceae bacterium]